MKIYKFLFFILVLLSLVLVISCTLAEYNNFTREDKIPTTAVKQTPESDLSPPILHSDEFEPPVPLATISTAGAEDSPFVPAGSNDLYFFFTPDVSVPVEKQILDGVTGIWFSEYKDGGYQEPTRIWLQKPDKLSGDGCEFVEGNEMLFCTVREGYTGIHWFRAEYMDDKWQNWEKEYLPEDVGELHIWEDEIYYHYDDGTGSDMWMRTNVDGEWVNPTKVEAVSSSDFDGFPYITPDGNEMWFNRFYLGTPGTFRSERINGEWQEPELIVSMFAGEPTLDKDGNLFFVHH